MNLEELFKTLQIEYLKTFEAKILNMKNFLLKKDFEKLEMEFHKMKGTGSTHNVPEISELGQRMEDYLSKAQTADLIAIEDSIQILEDIVKIRNEAKPYELSSCTRYQNLVKKTA